MTDTKDQVLVNMPSGNYLFVKVPKDSFRPHVHNGGKICVMIPHGEFASDHHFIELQPGHTYTLIGLASTLNDEQWGKIVEKTDTGFFKIYGAVATDDGNWYTGSSRSTESGHSLVIRERFTIEECLILKID